MKFKPAPPNPFYDNYHYTQRLESETGRWSIFLEPVLYGVRVIVSKTNSPIFSLSICCGKDQADIIMVYATVVTWLSQFEETILPGELEIQFPRFERKPVWKNPQWHEFMESLGHLKI